MYVYLTEKNWICVLHGKMNSRENPTSDYKVRDLIIRLIP